MCMWFFVYMCTSMCIYACMFMCMCVDTYIGRSSEVNVEFPPQMRQGLLAWNSETRLSCPAHISQDSTCHCYPRTKIITVVHYIIIIIGFLVIACMLQFCVSGKRVYEVQVGRPSELPMT